jgi:hypothetical protein
MSHDCSEACPALRYDRAMSNSERPSHEITKNEWEACSQARDFTFSIPERRCEAEIIARFSTF